MDNGYLGLETERESLTFGGFIADCARRHGDREALVSGDRRITYRDLESEVRQFAKALLAAGVTKGSTVALMLGNRPEFVVAAFGAGSIGAIVVPVSTFASAERDYILRHSDASILVTQPSLLNHRFVDELLESHPELADGPSGQLRSTVFPFLRRIVSAGALPARPGRRGGYLVDRADDVPDELLDAAMAEVHPRDPGIVIYTSGTSANPKAVLHANGTPIIQSWRWAEALGLTDDDTVLSRFPYFWSGGFAMTLGGPLAAGATVVTSESFTPDVVLDLVEREQVTVLQAMPHTYSESWSTRTSPSGTCPRCRWPSAPNRWSPPFPIVRGGPRPTGTASPRRSPSARGPTPRRCATATQASSAQSTAARSPVSTCGSSTPRPASRSRRASSARSRSRAPRSCSATTRPTPRSTSTGTATSVPATPPTWTTPACSIGAAGCRT